MPKRNAPKGCTAVITVRKDPKVDFKKVLGLPGGIRYARSSIKVIEFGDKLTIRVKASDATALRASINAVMRDLQTIEETGRLKERPTS